MYDKVRMTSRFSITNEKTNGWIDNTQRTISRADSLNDVDSILANCETKNNLKENFNCKHFCFAQRRRSLPIMPLKYSKVNKLI